jgi:putative hydrolase of the HAD superfamily
MIKAVVFDMDNTLVDFMRMKNDAIVAAVHAMIDAGLDKSFEEVKAVVDAVYQDEGIEYQHVFDKVIIDLTGSVNYKILASGIIAYRRLREATLVPYKHAFATIYAIARKGLKLAVVSDAPRLEAWLRLCYLNLHHMFDAVVTFDDTGERKPSPLPFKRVLSLLDVEAENTIMVGDWEERDIVGAKNVGMITAFARYGDIFGVKESKADYDLPDISDLVSIIDTHNAREAR